MMSSPGDEEKKQVGELRNLASESSSSSLTRVPDLSTSPQQANQESSENKSNEQNGRELGDIEKNESSSDPSQKTPMAIDPSAFPDGGLQAWTVVVGAFFALFVSFGWINCKLFFLSILFLLKRHGMRKS